MHGDPANALHAPHHWREGGEFGHPLDLPIPFLTALQRVHQERMVFAIDGASLKMRSATIARAARFIARVHLAVARHTGDPLLECGRSFGNRSGRAGVFADPEVPRS